MNVLRKTFGSRNPPALWSFLATAVLLVAYAFTQLQVSDVAGYWTGVVSTATVFTVFSCGYAAVSASVEGSRVRRAHIANLAPARSSLSIAARGCAPVVVLALVLQLVGFFLTAADTWGAPGAVPWAVPLAWISMIVFHASMGYVIGLKVPFAAAAPLALTVSYVWLGFTWSVAYIPLRYLSGLAISGCCAPYAELAPAAPWATFLFSAFGILAMLVVIAQLGRVRQVPFWARLAPAVPLALGAVGGLVLASGLGPYPSPQRSSADLQCTRANTTDVCFYPEQTWNTAPPPTQTIEGALVDLAAAGYKTPSKVTGQLNQGTDDASTVSMAYRREFDTETTLRSLTSALTQPERIPVCEQPVTDKSTSRIEYARIAAAVLYVNAGGDIGSATGKDVTRDAEAALSLPPDEQVTWVNEVLQDVHTCNPLPPIPTDAP